MVARIEYIELIATHSSINQKTFFLIYLKILTVIWRIKFILSQNIANFKLSFQ